MRTLLLAADLAVRDQRVGAVAPPLPAVPGADDVFALDGATDAHVGAEVQAVGVEHVHLAGLGAKQHQFLAEVVHPLDLTGGQFRGEADDEPARREPVRRQRYAGRTELTFRRIVVGSSNRVRHDVSVSRAAERNLAGFSCRVRRLALFLLF